MPSMIPPVALFFAVVSASFVASADPPVPPAPSHAEAPRAIYRFDITLRRPDDAPNARLPTYTLNLEERHSGTVSIGTNIPLLPSGAAAGTVSPRQDVGLMLHINFVLQGNVVVVSGDAEMSTADTAASGPVSIHRIRADGVVPLTAGHPGVFTSIADMTTRRSYEIVISATRLL